MFGGRRGKGRVPGERREHDRKLTSGMTGKQSTDKKCPRWLLQHRSGGR